jgi:hypothetical protein
MKLKLAVIASLALAASPAFAQIDLGLGAGVDVDARLDVDVRADDPYVYDGYYSGRWYPYEEPRRAGRWNERYGGYDCYHAFQYTWDDGHRTRYESYWCFDERGREYEVRRTRVAVRID